MECTTEHMMESSWVASGVFFSVIIGFLILGAIITAFWVLPIMLGVRCAKRKNYSPAWMCFGIHPLGGWIAFIVLSCLPARIQCPNCGGFVQVNFKICPYCRAGINPPPNSAVPASG